MTRTLLFDTEAACAPWRPIDDRVMGGLSGSRFRPDAAGWAVFEGEVSLLNNGGFASVRASTRALAHAGATGYALNVLGDGKRYKFSLRTDPSFDGLSYQAGFQPPAGVWTAVIVPLAELKPSYRGRPAPNAPALQTEQVCQVGWMIADGQAGRFALGIRSVAVC